MLDESDRKVERPILSIVIVTLDAREPLARTLASITSQSHIDLRDIEMILVDGGSRDKTVDYAVSSGLFSKVVSEPDRGIYDAMNKGARAARSSWLHFLNAGDTFHDELALQTIVSGLDSATRSGRPWVVARAVNNAAGGRLIRNVPHRWGMHAIGLQPHCHQATFVRRHAFEALGGYSLEFGTAGDYDLIMRLGLIEAPLEISEIVINYEGGGVSSVGPWTTARLLSTVRRVRWQLDGNLAAIESAVTFGVGALTWVRIRLGQVRRMLKGRVR